MSDNLIYTLVSCGTPHDSKQKRFRDAVDVHLRSHGCESTTVGQNRHTLKQPIAGVRDVIAKSDGIIVIAFERTRIIEGLDKPGTTEQKVINNESHPTVWNQMEAAMGYGQHLPVLTLVQNGLSRQGMLSKRMEYVAIQTDLTPALLAGDPFQQIFREWLLLVKERRSRLAAIKEAEELKNKKKEEEKAKEAAQPSRLKDIINMFVSLETRDAYAVVVPIFGILAMVSTTSYKVGQWSKEIDASKPRAATTSHIVTAAPGSAQQ